MADYQIARKCLQENIDLMTNSDGSVPPANIALWNISNALQILSESLEQIQGQLTRIEQQSRR